MSVEAVYKPYIPLSKLSLGQPVECVWDYRGHTLGIVTAKLWEERYGGGFWRYWVKTSIGNVYKEIESQMRGVKLKKVVLNVVRS